MIRTCAAPIDAILVSPEMTALLGTGAVDDVHVPADSAALVFAPGGLGCPASIRIAADARAEPLGAADEGASSVTLVVMRAALDRIFGWDPAIEDGHCYHMKSEHRIILMAMRSCASIGAAREPYLLAKSIELLCETVQALRENALVPLAPECALSTADTGRVVEAKRMIDEKWSEKLTLDMIARACGLNRAKLTRGFRDIFACSVADAIAMRRLGEAGQMLVATDLPVSTIGYRCGYLNNASFARAFSRHFGIAPTKYRAHGLAA